MRYLALAIILALSACASKQEPSEYDVVLKRPKPVNDEARRQECSWIATSIERQKSLASYITASSTYPAVALAHQDATQRNMAVLQSRAQAISCQAETGSFDACFARCRQTTERSKEQCFDACNK